jgi:hypothetical protein
MKEPWAVVFEMLGVSGPAWVVKEGFVLPLFSAPDLRRLAEQVAGEAPHWHRPSDTVDKMDREVLTRAYRFVRKLLTAMDELSEARAAS